MSTGSASIPLRRCAQSRLGRQRLRCASDSEVSGVPQDSGAGFEQVQELRIAEVPRGVHWMTTFQVAKQMTDPRNRGRVQEDPDVHVTPLALGALPVHMSDHSPTCRHT